MLLLVYREQEREWTVASIARELRTSGVSAERCASLLVERGLLVPPDPARPAYKLIADAMVIKRVEELQQAYRERPVAVIEHIYAPGRDPLRDFVDAFDLRKKKDG